MANWDAIMGIAQLAQSGMSMARSASAKKKAEESKPPLEDPETRDMYEGMKQRLRAVRTGAETAPEMRETRQMVAETQQEMTRSTGGDVAGTMNAMLQAQREGQRNVNQIIGQRRKYYTGLVRDMQQRIAQRRMELQQYDRLQALAQSAQSEKRGMAGMQGLLSNPDAMKSIAGLLGGGGGSSPEGGGGGGGSLQMDNSGVGGGGPDAYAPEARMGGDFGAFEGDDAFSGSGTGGVA